MKWSALNRYAAAGSRIRQPFVWYLQVATQSVQVAIKKRMARRDWGRSFIPVSYSQYPNNTENLSASSNRTLLDHVIKFHGGRVGYSDSEFTQIKDVVLPIVPLKLNGVWGKHKSSFATWSDVCGVTGG